jgi:hypothetical protein
MGEMLRSYSARIAGLVCGHTHRTAGPLDLGGFAGLNVGSDYGAPRGWVIDTEEPAIRIQSMTELMV